MCKWVDTIIVTCAYRFFMYKAKMWTKVSACMGALDFISKTFCIKYDLGSNNVVVVLIKPF